MCDDAVMRHILHPIAAAPAGGDPGLDVIVEKYEATHLASARVPSEGNPNFETVAKLYESYNTAGKLVATSGTVAIALKGITFSSADVFKVRISCPRVCSLTMNGRICLRP